MLTIQLTYKDNDIVLNCQLKNANLNEYFEARKEKNIEGYWLSRTGHFNFAPAVLQGYRQAI
ncbi:hypothetical protein GCM10020008_22020 [Lentilactobacillus kefiri DSM 20587 = JCM 5818]|uniref:Uncharacterized protein n=1 Tax=Lentilactobacillus kefiri TaxID=33962 RepID=A0A511DT95_LENKE|nr:hypothetical protein LKE01_08720 [Lentilactobacillus kefiri]